MYQDSERNTRRCIDWWETKSPSVGMQVCSLAEGWSASNQLLLRTRCTSGPGRLRTSWTFGPGAPKDLVHSGPAAPQDLVDSGT